jgi:hypothetical protein
MLNDPYGALHEGSLSTVSATKSYKLRGLNSGSCANSAEAIISQLFDKKRLQLCAVWVTTPTSPSPFQVINDAVRKYDSLRWKYIGAFIDSMKLCKRRETLEVFLSWCYSCRRDLPSFYDASAASKGGNPIYLHIKDKLIGGSGLLCSIRLAYLLYEGKLGYHLLKLLKHHKMMVNLYDMNNTMIKKLRVFPSFCRAS